MGPGEGELKPGDLFLLCFGCEYELTSAYKRGTSDSCLAV